MTALILVTKIVRTAVEYISILGIHLNDQVSILALGALTNIMFFCYKKALCSDTDLSLPLPL